MAPEEEPRLPEPSRRSNVVTVGFGILITVILVCFVVQQWMQAAAIARPVDKFHKKLGSSGLAPGAPKAVSIPVQPAADKVFEIDIHGKTFWVCYFDPADKKQTESLATVRDRKTIEFNGKSRPVKIHGELVLVGYDGHPDEEKIVQAFAEFEDAPESH